MDIGDMDVGDFSAPGGRREPRRRRRASGKLEAEASGRPLAGRARVDWLVSAKTRFEEYGQGLFGQGIRLD